MMKKIICLVLFLNLFQLLQAQQDSSLQRSGSSISGPPYSIDSFSIVGKPITGTAGTYSSKADGTKTASGQIFNNADFTAACNQFKFNTWVKVTNLKNRKYVLVLINDRTSKKKGAAIIELSRAAVGKLGFLKTGLSKVKVEEISLSDSFIVNKDTINIAPIKDTVGIIDTTTPNGFKTIGKSITGIASFYSHNLDGTETATGEIYRNSKLTAASNNFKLNTWVLVTNLKNKKSVIVRINDRMHPRMKKKGRVVDMSGEAARLLDFKEDGLTKVKVEPVIFFNSPIVRKELDSLTAVSDSIKYIDSVKADSVKTDSVKTDGNIVFGIASFYSTNLDGTKTSTGEIYRNSKLSAASNDFELNTWVRITNLKNNKSIILRINDHMHSKMQKKGRVVDLSRIAAKRLDFIKNGLAKVKVEVVPKGTKE